MTLQNIWITSTDPQIELERRIDSILDNQLLHSYLIKIYYI